MTDPGTFYGGQDFWQVPDGPDPGAAQPVDQPPYYLTLQMPGQAEPPFSLTTTFMPSGDREVLTGFLAVDAERRDDGREAQATDYGKLRLLELPKDSNVTDPGRCRTTSTSSNVRPPTASAWTLSQFLNNAQTAGLQGRCSATC